MDNKNRLGEFIAKLRKEKGISLEQLSDGICDLSMLSRFERGEREPEKLMQNRFLTRLGVVPENYENFLYYKEYCRWEKRQGILHHILENNIRQARYSLEEYRKEYDMNYSLEKQFYLAMLAQIRRCEGCDPEELAELFGEALQLTVPEVDSRSFLNRVLSLEELNLLLEYRYCRGQRISFQFYETLLAYIDKMIDTPLAKAKIYPKTVYYYFETWKRTEGNTMVAAEYLNDLCDKAIELLRNANRMFYLWEMFCVKEELVSFLPPTVQKDKKFIQNRTECRNWKKTLEELYKEYSIPIEMKEYCYVYIESENYCIGDVIRVRRKMLGLSQEKLCQGICDSRTVSRLERNIMKPQREIVQLLFDRLNLSTELYRTELVTDSQEAIEKYRELRTLNNRRELALMHRKIAELKQMISTMIPTNKQILLRKEIRYQYNCGLITQEEYTRGIKEALECTVLYKNVLMDGEKYLTNEELSCMQNMIVIHEKEYVGHKEYMNVLIRYYESKKYPENYLRMYQFVMSSVSSYFGNIGEYASSNEICKNMIKLLLSNRRLGGIHEALYTLLWNYEEECKKQQACISQEKIKNEIRRCINIARMVRNIGRTQKYINKLDSIENNYSGKK